MPTVYPYIGGVPSKARFENNSGLALSGGLIYFYEAGTSTPKDTYSDAAGTVANTNPVVLDSRGEADIFLLGDGAYKVTVHDSDDVLVYPTVDDVMVPATASVFINTLLDDADAAAARATLGAVNIAGDTITGVLTLNSSEWAGTGTQSLGVTINVTENGRTYLILLSNNTGSGNATASAVYMVRVGYDGDNFTATKIAGDDGGAGAGASDYTFSAVAGILHVASAATANHVAAIFATP